MGRLASRFQNKMSALSATTSATATPGVGARTGGYYYAHGAVATDPNFAKPQKITAEAAALAVADQDNGKLGPSQWNVNDYHWEEKDKTVWAKNRLNELLGNINVQLGKKGHVDISTVEVEGFMCVNVRKGKLIPLFELTLKVKWTGTMHGDKRNGPTVVEGSMSTRELNHEDATASLIHDLGDIWLEKKAECVVVEDENMLSGKDHTAVDRVLRQQTLLNKMFLKKCMPQLRTQLRVFLEEVRVN